jgi:hypothetical protein
MFAFSIELPGSGHIKKDHKIFIAINIVPPTTTKDDKQEGPSFSLSLLVLPAVFSAKCAPDIGLSIVFLLTALNTQSAVSTDRGDTRFYHEKAHAMLRILS